MGLLQKPLHMSDAAAIARNAWRWWTAELETLLPPSAREKLFGAREFLTFDVADQHVQIAHFVGRDREILHASVLESDASEGHALPPAVRERIIHLRRLGLPLVLRIPKKDILFRRVHLPKASGRDLEKLMSYEIERQSPLSLDAIRYDCRIVEDNESTQRVETILRILRKDTVEQAISACRQLAGEPTSIAMAGDGPPDEAEIFSFGRRWDLPVLLRRAVIPGLLAIACLLGAANLSAAYAKREAAIDAMNGRLAGIGGEVDKAVALQNRIVSAERRLSFGTEEKQRPLLVAVLDSVAATLPDDSWIFELDYKDGSLRIRGFAPDASQLLRQIDGSPKFENTEFRAPVMPGRDSDLERFDLAFDMGGPRQ